MIFRFRPGQLLVLTHAQVLKVGLSRAARLRIASEAENNKKARECPLWRDSVVPVSKYGCILRSRRYPSALPDHQAAVKDFTQAKLSRLDSAAKRPALELLDITVLKGFQAYGLDIDIINTLLDRLASYSLPQSASHGDFYEDNIVWCDESIGLIDWDSYRSVSSFVFDAVHYQVNRLQESSMGSSWTTVIFDDFSAGSEIQKIFGKFSVRVKSGLLGYALDRMAREVAQEGGLAFVGPQKKQKYIFMCKRLSSA